jgi:hypothetical protein
VRILGKAEAMSKPRLRVPFGWNDPDVRAHVGLRTGERYTVGLDVAELFPPEAMNEILKVALQTAAREFVLENLGALTAQMTSFTFGDEGKKIVMDEFSKACGAHFTALFDWELAAQKRRIESEES